MMTNEKKLFCFGYGYSCDYLGHELLGRGGWRVCGTSRDPEKKKALEARGVEAYLFNEHNPLYDAVRILDGTTHLLISTPPDDDGDPSFQAHAREILAVPTLQWVGYLSTTGVYGDRDGEWVDEHSTIHPTSQRGSRRAKAEDQWLSLYHNHGLPVHVFRLAGIYGPGRSALDTVRAGVARRVEKPGHVFSRIHVEDVVGTLLKSMENPNPGAAYNVADDHAVPSHEVIAYACELMGRPVPPLTPFEEAEMSPMALSFYSDNKRIRNDRIKNELGVDLKYKDYRAGLQACYEAEQYALSLARSSKGSPF